MMRTLSINRIKHHLPKGKVIFFFLPFQQQFVESENIEVYLSFFKPIQRNAQKLLWEYYFKRQEMVNAC